MERQFALNKDLHELVAHPASPQGKQLPALACLDDAAKSLLQT
jgi:hypothetical protein